MEGELMIKNLTLVLLAIMACLCYCHLISSRLPKGKWRLISLMPVFYVFTILPLYTSSTIFASIIGFLISWMANFKLLLFAFDQGPIVSKPLQKKMSSSLPIFIIMAALPFKVKPKNDDGSTKKKSKKLLPLSLANEIPTFIVVASILQYYKEYIHTRIQMVGYGSLVFLSIEIVIELSGLLVRAVLGLEVEPPSDEPYLATSPQDFWGRRWNITFGSILRETVHNPVRSATASILGRDWAALPGILATFLVSGLMHELNAWYITRANPSWEITRFFVVHGVFVMVQRGLKVAFPGKNWNLPRFVSVALTIGFMAGTSSLLFWPAFMMN